jgi:hypothetical protein
LAQEVVRVKGNSIRGLRRVSGAIGGGRRREAARSDGELVGYRESGEREFNQLGRVLTP